MGTVSIMNLLDDITKLMKACGNNNLEYLRVGTSGGINIDPGSVIITDNAYKPDLTTGYKMTILGKDVIFPTQMNQNLNERIIRAQPEIESFKLYRGNSIAADDFYLGQARFDGAIKPKYTKEMQQEYFKKIMALGVYNFDMESTAIASFCNRAGIAATMIAVTLLNRLDGDQVTATAEKLREFANRAQMVTVNYLLSQIS
jgi:uridine phosphorylase